MMREPKIFLQAFGLAMLLYFSGHVPAFAADFVPEEVFAGRSTGIGELRFLFRKPQSFEVESTGALRDDGAFVLQQKIEFQGRPAESRTWLMRRVNAHEYTATLTDAAGPVVARINGPRMTLRYPLKRCGLVMHQTLDLSEDGRTIDNRGTIKLLGIPIGHLRETIYRRGDSEARVKGRSTAAPSGAQLR